MKNKALFYLINAPFWVAALAFAYSVGLRRYYFYSDSGWFTSDFSFTVFHSLVLLLWVLAGFYLFYSFLVPKYLFQGLKSKFFRFAAAWAFLVGPLLLIFLAEANHFFHMGEYTLKWLFNYPPMLALVPSYVMWVLFSLIPAFLGGIFRLAYESFSNIEKTRELENKSLQQELQMIKSKLNPHLFFNTLNNIDTLIETNPTRASATLSRLSELLRYVIYHTDTEFNPIELEVENLERYIELEKIRLLNPDYVSFSVNIPGKTKIPSMMFFPFVENGFKHSNLNLPDQNLQIELFQDENRITFQCTNTIAEQQTIHESEGIGLKLAARRLKLLYPQKHKLNITRNSEQFSVFLEIYP